MTLRFGGKASGRGPKAVNLRPNISVERATRTARGGDDGRMLRALENGDEITFCTYDGPSKLIAVFTSEAELPGGRSRCFAQFFPFFCPVSLLSPA